MNTVSFNVRAVLSAAICPLLVAATFFPLNSSSVSVSAQQKTKSFQAKAEAKTGAADQQARRRAVALLAQMTLAAHNLTQNPGEQEKRYWNERAVPLYPFGYGLSYTTFAFSNLRVSQREIKIGENLEVTVDVKNTGSRAGDEVVQLYVHQQAGTASRPIRELKGFERVTLAPGETKTISLRLGPDELRYWSAAVKNWVQEAESFDVWVGNDSTASLHSTFKIIDR